ncbi:hypothetical protein WJX75_004814 [Coccomyxa subellipsoidea]|uniref:Ribosomal RNA-processing protein 43 n=1 Tax=Coccomyxa subellipsoidea TaxID=248742 RepID=A0ABR2YMQ8_9CHLO
MSAAVPSSSNELQAEAFKRLYPNEYYAKFISKSLRPDGRPLGGARATTIGIHPLESTNSSALVKIGNTTAMAGMKLQHFAISSDQPVEGDLAVSVEMAAFASSETRPGRQSEAAQCVQEQIRTALRSAGAVELGELAIDKSHAWAVFLDIYVLNADGSLLDVCLLAAVSALLGLRLPHVEVNDQGQVVTKAEMGGSAAEVRRFGLKTVPMALTCGLYSGHLIADPTSEEETLAASLVSTIVDASGCIVGLYKAGGSATADEGMLLQCIEATKIRYKELMVLLKQALAEKGIQDTGI